VTAAVLAVAEQDDVGGGRERGREAEPERRPGDEVKPMRRHGSF
jgi:hypothetical protein